MRNSKAALKYSKIWRITMRFILLSIIMVVGASFTAYANNEFSANAKVSTVGFAGKHAGMEFSGVFEKWQASLRLPPLDNPSIKASFDLSSAKTGDFTYDSTLPEGDWFDVKNHPTGSFVSESIEASEQGFRVTGLLTLRGISKTQSFELISQGDALIAKFDIDRLDYAIGVESDPEAEWVSRNIQMSLEIKP